MPSDDPVWRYFTTVGEHLHECNICRRRCKAHGVGNLKSHLRHLHKHIHVQVRSRSNTESVVSTGDLKPRGTTKSRVDSPVSTTERDVTVNDPIERMFDVSYLFLQLFKRSCLQTISSDTAHNSMSSLPFEPVDSAQRDQWSTEQVRRWRNRTCTTVNSYRTLPPLATVYNN